MPESSTKPFERLPKSVVAEHYNICIQPSFADFSFTGETTVDVQVTSSVDQIVVNALELTLSKAEFEDCSGAVHKSKSITLNAEEGLAVIVFETPLPVGKGTLSLNFEGLINDKMAGFYRSKYLNNDGEERYCAITHFEPTDARRAFPCWDEPALKATFDITLIVPKDKVALSNMNVISDKETGAKGELREVKFARTPIMSTYLVAFAVGEFDYVESFSTDGIQVRVYTPVNKKEQGLFALGVAAKTITYIKDYFKIAYPLPKLDLIAVGDLSFGAMENWGLITYRESLLLIDLLNSSTTQKQAIAIVVTHELSHMWFGNLVTMEWWTHLWLNEGFATFFSFDCVNNLFPEYDIWTQFISSEYSWALELDSLNNSHPIEVPVHHPEEITEIFDDISYNKGASIIRMLNKLISDEVFQKGLHNYLKQNSYSNCSTEHLWQALEDVSNKSVTKIMSTWTQQKGYPFITVSSKPDGNNLVLCLTQGKFEADDEDDESSALWAVPISISTANKPDQPIKEILLETRSCQVVLENVAQDQQIIVNPGASGFYRVKYSMEIMDQLVPGVRDQSLAPIDRLSLQSDLFAMVQVGKASSVEVLKLIEAYKNETNYTVWNSISNCLELFNRLLSHLDYQDLFHSYCRKLFAKIHSKLGWEPIKGECHTDAMLRDLVISWLALAQDESVLAEAKHRFEAHANNISILPADLRNVVYKAAASQGDGKTFDTLLKLYRSTDLSEEKERLSLALGDFKNKEEIERVLDFSFSEEVRCQDALNIIIEVSRTKHGRDMAWEFIQVKKQQLVSQYIGQSSNILAKMFKSVLENFASEEKAQEIENFFAQNNFPGSARNVLQALETIRSNAHWLGRDQTEIRNYLSSHK